jgi:F-type H+-transporting ATPase subunit a
LVIATLLISAYFIGRNLKLSPGRFQAGIENFFEYVLDMMASTLGSRTLAQRYFPLIATIFIFILASNWLEFLPFIGSVGIVQNGTFVPLLHTPTADLNTTLALAIISFFVIEISGIATLGVLKYGSKFVNFKGGAIGFAVGLLEIVGNLARLISFSFRLFGAIFAGEVLLLVISTFVPYILPVPLMAFEAFIGLLQAAVFAILTMAFIKIAIDEPHGSHEAHAPASAH